MTREEAIEFGKRILLIAATDDDKTVIEFTKMAIQALENIGHLKDRPCSVCEFNKENGCCKWTCVFTDRLFGGMNE